MIVKKRDESTITTTTEDADDLLALRRVIKCGDIITGSTTRVIKRDRDYSRPDRGERVRIIASVIVEKISLDGTLDRLRISGTVSESNNEAVPHGTHHSMTVNVTDSIAITKKGTKSSESRSHWSKIEYNILKGNVSSAKKTNFVLVAIDTSDCGVAVLKGTHLEYTPNLYSGRGGKRYKTNHNIEGFFEQVVTAINAILDNHKNSSDSHNMIMLFGPGNTKNRFANYINVKQTRGVHKYNVTIVEGIDSGGEDGIHIFIKSSAMQEAMSDSKLALVSHILDNVIKHAHKKIPRYSIGYKETYEAVKIGAVESLIFSDQALQQHNNEQKIIELLNMAEQTGASVYGVDASTDIGLRTSGLGGIVALLRYAVRQ